MNKFTFREIYTAITSIIFLSAVTAFLHPLGLWGNIALGAIIAVHSLGLLAIGRDMECKDREKNTRVINIDNLTPEERQEVQNILLGKVNSTDDEPKQ